MIKQLLSILAILLIATYNPLQAQDVIKITGKVLDSRTKEPLPFVDVYFKGSYVGTSTDLDGAFSIETKFPTDSLSATFIGYDELSVPIKKNQKKQTIDFLLNETSVVATEVTIVAKKKKYSRKNNPAVDLIRKVMENKGQNRLEKNDYYSYHKHEKIQMDLNNITEDYTNKKVFKNFEFIWEYLDTSEVNGKVYLPLFMRETLSDVYYKKDGDTKKEYKNGVKITQFDEALDQKSINSVINLLYQDVDIYENDINLMDKHFVGPIAPVGISFYRYYILDTLAIQNQEAIRLAFIPKNKLTSGFVGDLYISTDGNYSVLKADLGILGDININFIRDLKINQVFTKDAEGNNILTTDKITIDYALRDNGIGFYASRNVVYDDISYAAIDDKWFSPDEAVITPDEAYAKDESYWKAERIEELSSEEENIYKMVDTIKEVPTYKRFVYFMNVALSGYIPLKKIDFGPLATFISGNDVEGLRVRMGIESSHRKIKKVKFESYVAYGTRDKAWKYFGGALYTFNKDHKENPKHYIKGSFGHDVVFPGVRLEFLRNDNALLSIRRGRSDRMLLEDTYKVNYHLDTDIMSYHLTFFRKNSKPYGTLTYPYTENGQVKFVDEINTSEFSANVEIAPGKEFIQGRQYQTPIFNKYPIFNINLKAGIKGLFGGDYSYQRATFNAFKRFDVPLAGKVLLELEGSKIFGSGLPYTSLHIPRANQAYSYQRLSYNMMNFMEFVTDQYGKLRVVYFMDGYFLNRVPLIRLLKLKEVVTCKAIYGTVTDGNNPNMNPGLIQFPVNENGVPTTYGLGDKPYIEVSAGLYNIFKIFRIDIVQRLNYLDHPDLPRMFGRDGLGIRGRFKVEF